MYGTWHLVTPAARTTHPIQSTAGPGCYIGATAPHRGHTMPVPKKPTMV